jgi:AAA family ATP:ADP antiporter
MSTVRNRLVAFCGRAFGIRPEEFGPVAYGFLLFFLLFAGYFMLRPVRETMGIAGGVDNLQWLFTATFVCTLIALPLFGWLAARVRRRRILPWTYGFFATNLVVFAIGFLADPENIWYARTFYVWLSVFNLLAISVAWSVLVDLFTMQQSKRLFALMAAGASLGGLTGPILGTLLVGVIGHAGLLLLSAGLLVAAIGASQALQHWRDRQPVRPEETLARSRPLGGSPFAGASAVLRSPYLLGIAAFVLLLATVTTFLYFEQARLVEANFPDRVDQTRVFGIIDTTVQTLSILAQIFITGHIARRLGIGILLVAVPVIVAGGFLWLALAPVFAVFAVVMVVRRAGEYAFVRPGREMLYTVVPAEAKYKAKNFIDTVVYRGADAVSAWTKAFIDVIAQQPAVAAVIGAGIALVWGGTGAALARRQVLLSREQENGKASSGPTD